MVGALGTVPMGQEKTRKKQERNKKCRVASGGCTPWNSTLKKCTIVWLG